MSVYRRRRKKKKPQPFDSYGALTRVTYVDESSFFSVSALMTTTSVRVIYRVFSPAISQSKPQNTLSLLQFCGSYILRDDL